MALKIGLSSYVSAGFTNPVRWDLKEDVSSILIDTHAEAGPHGQVYNFDWSNGIRDIAYRIEFYDVPGGIGIGNLIKSHVVTPSTQTLILDADIELVVDGGQVYDPVSGAGSVIIAQLLGKDYYVMQRGVGQLLATRNIEIIDDTVNGGFALTGGNTFNADDTFIVKIRPQYIVNPPGSQSASTIYKDVVLITADQAITSLDFGKLFIVDGAAAVVTLTFDAIATLIQKVPIWIKSIGTTHINVVLKAAMGETITAMATTSNSFILGKGEEAQVINLGAVLYGFCDSVDIRRVGQLDWGYTVGINRLWADGNASAPGGLDYACADYPRLKKAMDLMQVGTVVTFAQWNSSVTINGVILYPFKGFFALSNDTLTFKVPDLRNKIVRSLRYSNATVDDQRLQQGAGGLQNEDIGSHRHFVAFNGSANGNFGLDATKSIYAQKENNGDFKYTLEGNAGEATLGRTSVAGGVEMRMLNVGMIPLIIT